MNGVLYFSSPDHVWAVDARTGRERWHYFWKTRGGIHIGNRGVGMYGNWLYFLTPDNYFVSLDATTGKERWHKEIANVKREYFSTAAPIVIRNHVIIGVGGRLARRAGLSRVARSGDAASCSGAGTRRRGRASPAPRPGPTQYSMAHGGGMPWLPGTYDPELNLYYFGTGNANPVLVGQEPRRATTSGPCSIVALNPDTGKMAWYYQATPHDTHDWDAAQTPVLIDGVIDGKPRKLIAQANRNGHFFLLDRTNGQHVLTTPLIDSLNWTKGLNAKGQPMPDPAKEATCRARSCRPTTDGATNWPPPSFSPDTGLFYVGTTQCVQRLLSDRHRPAARRAGRRPSATSANLGAVAQGHRLQDRQGRWSRPLAMNAGGAGGGPMGLLSTAGRLLFGNDGGGNFVAYDAATGKPLWHAGLGSNTSNGPQTYPARRPPVRRGRRGRSALRVHASAIDGGIMYTRRQFGQMSLAALALPRALSATAADAQKGVKLGVQTYSFRELPRTEGGDAVDAIIKAMTDCGITECELWSPQIEPRPATTPGAPRPAPDSPEAKKFREDCGPAARRRSSTFRDQEEVRRGRPDVFGYNYSFGPTFTDEEIDRGFEMARALGA